MEVDYQVVSLEKIMTKYAKTFQIPGKTMWSHDCYIDTARNEVVFKLTFDDTGLYGTEASDVPAQTEYRLLGNFHYHTARVILLSSNDESQYLILKAVNGSEVGRMALTDIAEARQNFQWACEAIIEQASRYVVTEYMQQFAQPYVEGSLDGLTTTHTEY